MKPWYVIKRDDRCDVKLEVDNKEILLNLYYDRQYNKKVAYNVSELIGKYMYTFILFPKMEVSKSFIL